MPDPGGRLRFEQLVPGDALLQRITRHLDERRLIGTRLAVGPPFYQGVTVVATVHAFRGVDTDRVRRQTHDALYRHLAPAHRRRGRHRLAVRPARAGGRGLRGAATCARRRTRLRGAARPADPLTGKRGDPTDRIDLEAPSLVFSFDHLGSGVIGDGS